MAIQMVEDLFDQRRIFDSVNGCHPPATMAAISELEAFAATCKKAILFGAASAKPVWNDAFDFAYVMVLGEALAPFRTPGPGDSSEE